MRALHDKRTHLIPFRHRSGFQRWDVLIGQVKPRGAPGNDAAVHERLEREVVVSEIRQPEPVSSCERLLNLICQFIAHFLASYASSRLWQRSRRIWSGYQIAQLLSVRSLPCARRRGAGRQLREVSDRKYNVKHALDETSGSGTYS